MATHGAKKWSKIAEHLPGRIGKQCRERYALIVFQTKNCCVGIVIYIYICIFRFRWHNHLNPNVSKAPWSADEDRLIAELHAKYGNQWAQIAKMLPGRTDNGVFCVLLEKKNIFF